MIRFLAVLLLLLSIRETAAAPTVAGLWLTEDRDGVIEIAPCGNVMCARLVGVFLDHPDDPMPRDYRGVSQCDLALISDARQIGPNLWKGHIMDPRTGDMWGVELRLNADGNLALRGFLGVPLLGHTQTWTRYPGRPPADCRIGGPNTRIG